MMKHSALIPYDPNELPFHGTEIEHNLGTTDIIFQVWDEEGHDVRHLWAYQDDANALTVGFGSTETRAQYKLPPIESDAVTVVMIG